MNLKSVYFLILLLERGGEVERDTSCSLRFGVTSRLSSVVSTYLMY